MRIAIALEGLFFVLVVLLIYSVFRGPNFWKSVFSDAAGGSLARVMMAVNGVFALSWISFVIWRKGEIPGPGELFGIAAYVTSPYAINQAASFGKSATVPKAVTAEPEPLQETK